MFRKGGKWLRYLPRRIDGVKEFDYEEAGGSLAHFKRELEAEGASSTGKSIEDKLEEVKLSCLSPT